MEIEDIVEHDPPDKWVERKSQSMDEVGTKYYPLMGFWSRDDLPRVWQPVCDIRGQISGSP